MALLIKNGIIGNAEKSFRGDVLVDGGKIIETGESIICFDADEIDAEGKYVLPGGVDPHTHVILRSGDNSVSDGFEAATKAALWGGTTTIVEHPGFAPAGLPLSFAVDETVKAGENASYTDFGVHLVFQRYDDAVADEISGLIGAGFATGKVYTTYDGRLTDEDVFPLMKKMVLSGGLLLYHAENNAIAGGLAAEFQNSGPVGPMAWPMSRPDYCEAEAIGRILALAKSTESRTYIVHLSTCLGLKKIIEARRGGQIVYAETCPQYLCLTENCYEKENGLDYVMAPPLRKQGDCDALWKAIGNGGIDTVGTDHCSFSRADKVRLGGENIFKSPGGIPGIETRMPIIFSEGFLKGRISLEQFVGVTSTNPARILGLREKGRIEAGADADIVIIDPHTEKVLSVETLHQKVDYTPYEGMKIRGLPTHVWLRGSPMLVNGEFIATKPSGCFVKRYL
ncbi:MAG: dihydropyrimidinase [Synergistaceae bacterium]|nr:dihydropyrimidinase [Synergistaceae bacterium]